MSTCRVLARQQGEVHLRWTHHIPLPVYALVVGALDHEELEEFGPIVVFAVAPRPRPQRRAYRGSGSHSVMPLRSSHQDTGAQQVELDARTAAV